ncbi:MAG: AAA family ATPase [Candidatus Micrarchaeia archaeon]
MVFFIGLTGTFGSGKGSFSEILCRKTSCAFYSLSDEVRKECERQGKSFQRDSLRAVANETRRREGVGVFAKRVLQKALKDEGKQVVIVDSVRTPGEVEALRNALGKRFVLVAVDAPLDVRYERVKERARAQEQLLSLEQFKESENVEMHSKDPFGQDLSKVMQSADYTVENTGSTKELEEKAGCLLKKFLRAV